MAVVAIHTVVYIAANALVPVVGLCFRVAIGALENAIVARIRVANGTNSVCSAMIRGEIGVVEGGAEPTCRGVACGTSCWKARTHVVRIVGPFIVRLVAAVAVSRQRRVVIVHVAIRTRHTRVSSSQWETRIVVIESGRCPCRGAVANVALLRETSRNVARVVRILKISQVARHACRVR